MAASDAAASEVVVAREMADALKDELGGMPLGDNIGHRNAVEEEERAAKRVEALTMRLAGFSIAQIADRLKIDDTRVSRLINTTLQRAENQTVAEMRQVENQRLDRAQLAVWQDVLKGDVKAIDTFLKISQQRSKINGLYAPTKIDMNIGIRNEMQGALADLERLMQQRAAEIVDVEVVGELEAGKQQLENYAVGEAARLQAEADIYDPDEPEYVEQRR
jgi:predicted XRE-type DNA-binding protein